MGKKAIRLFVCLNIDEDRFDQFKRMVQAMAESVESTEPNTLSYEWYTNTSEGKCYISEHYPDSESFLTHLDNVGAALGPLLEVAPLTELLVFGTPTDEAAEVLSGFGAKIFPYIAGFSR